RSGTDFARGCGRADSLRLQAIARTQEVPMATVFTRIIDGEIPGKFIWADARCVAFLSIEPLRPGHVLVVPREEIDQWVDLPEDLATHLLQVARSIGLAQRDAFDPARIGLMVQGYEVPPAQVHVWPSAAPADCALSSAERD